MQKKPGKYGENPGKLQNSKSFSSDSKFKTKFSQWSIGTYVFFNTKLFSIPMSKISP